MFDIKNTLIKALVAGFLLAISLSLAERAAASFFPLEPSLAVMRSEGSIPRGGALYNELIRNLPATETLAVTRALGGIYNLSRIRPDDSYTLYYSTTGSALRFVYDPDPMINYVVERSTSGLIAYEEVPEVEERLIAVSGQVQSSLYAGLAGSGVTDPRTIMNFADIFQWQMDFLTEVREGDKFSLVYKQYFVNGEPVRYGPILVAEYDGRFGTHRGLRFNNEGSYSYFKFDGDSLRSQFLRAPLNYTRISSHFTRARMHPIHRRVRPHLGIDYAAPTGTPVSAVGAGTVTFVGWKGGWGNTVRVRHNATYSSQYAHFSRFARGLRVGQRVSQGEVIGYVGMTGTATGPHLCYRFEVNGTPVNYLTQNFPSAESVSSANRERFEKAVEEAESYLELISGGYFFRNPSPVDEYSPLSKDLSYSDKL